MLFKTKAIVLSKLKYRDNDLIVKCYTEQKGITSYLIKGANKSSKKGSKMAYFQYLTQLTLEENFNPNRNLQYIKEIRLENSYSSLHSNLLKSSIAIFIAEVLAEVLKEEEKNLELYHFLETSLQWLDLKDRFQNFHLLFLLRLTKHLGFFPDVTQIELPYFNLSKGSFESTKHEIYSISENDIYILKELIGTNFDALEKIPLNSKQRQSFLKLLLLYFELHLGGFKKPKSLEIFNQVFH
ncbi:MAG: DNA repair protein RecO [Bacteroidota bacterium]